MTRSASSITARNKHKKILKLAKGYRGRSKNCYRIAIEKVEKGLQYAYRDRRRKKRDFRRLWIQRINAAVREHNLVYSDFMHKLYKAGVNINRKILSEIAIHNPQSFKSLVEKINA